MGYSKHDLAFPRAKFDEYEIEITSFKQTISDQGNRHKTVQIKNEKISNELNRLEDKIEKLKAERIKYVDKADEAWEKFCESDEREQFTKEEVVNFAWSFHEGGCKTCTEIHKLASIRKRVEELPWRQLNKAMYVHRDKVLKILKEVKA